MAWIFGELAGLGRHNQDILFIFGALRRRFPASSSPSVTVREPDKVAAIVMIGNGVFVPLALALRL